MAGGAERWTGRALAVVAVVFWSASFLWSKTVLDWLAPFAAAGARYLGAAVILMIAMALRRDNPLRILAGHWRGYVLMGFVGIACFQAIFFVGLRSTSPISASVIMAMTPAITAVGAAFFLGDPLRPRAVAGIALSAVGAVLAVLGDNPNGLAGLSLDAGEPLILLAAVCMAFYTIASRRLLRTDVSAVSNTTIVLTIGAVFLLPLGLTQVPEGPPPTPGPAIALLAVILGPTLIAYLAWNRAVGTIGVAEPNMLFNFIPVVTMALAALQGQRPWPEQMIGAALVLAGISLGMLPFTGLHHHRPPGVQPVH